MTFDPQWALEHLATKADISRVEAALTDQRAATKDLHELLHGDIQTRLMKADGRIEKLEQFQRDHTEERREHVRRHDDRRRQRVTWAIGLVGPLLALLALAYNGLRTMLEAGHIVGPR